MLTGAATQADAYQYIGEAFLALAEAARATPDPDEILTPQEAADRLRISRQTIYRWIADGRLEAVQVGDQYRITASALGRLG